MKHRGDKGEKTRIILLVFSSSAFLIIDSYKLYLTQSYSLSIDLFNAAGIKDNNGSLNSNKRKFKIFINQSNAM